MSHAEPTRASLLLRVRDAHDSRAWEEFAEIYTPLVRQYCRKRGLQETDADDVCQDVLQAVSGALSRFEYDRARGSFRSWLLHVTHNKLGHFFEKRKRNPQGSGETAVQKLLEAQPTLEAEQEWGRDYKRQLFDWACEQVHGEFQHKTWEAFRRTAVEEEDLKKVAEDLEMTAGAVYTARSRVLARIRERILEVGDE